VIKKIPTKGKILLNKLDITIFFPDQSLKK